MHLNQMRGMVINNTLVMHESFKAYNVNSLCHFTAIIINLINSAKLPSPLI